MLIQTTISNTIVQAQFYSRDVLTELLAMQSQGEDISQIKLKFILLGKWIVILQDYLDNNFDSNGNVTPAFPCLSQTEILELVAKVKVMIGNNRYIVPSNWILAQGIWNDDGVWDDNAVWNDFPPLS